MEFTIVETRTYVVEAETEEEALEQDLYGNAYCIDNEKHVVED